MTDPSPPPRDFRTELAVALGFLTLALMCLQFVLTARSRRLKAPFGSDLVYAFPRDITIAVLVFVAAHPVLLWFSPQREKVLVWLDFLGLPTFPRYGMYAVGCLAVLAAAALAAGAVAGRAVALRLGGADSVSVAVASHLKRP